VSKLKQFYYPETLEEASKILKDNSIRTSIIAGGSSVSIARDSKVEALVDITRLGLNYVKKDSSSVKVGATSVIRDLYTSDIAKNVGGGVLSKAASLIASRPLRNTITVGGNITQVKVWSDLPVVLLALDASIKIIGNQERVLTAEEFFREHPLKTLQQGEIVTEIIFPDIPATAKCEFIKFAKTFGDYAIATVCCKLDFSGSVCKSARIAVGSVSSIPHRCKEGENILENQEVTPKLIDACAEVCREKITTISNLWGTADYKSEVVENLVKRTLLNCLNKSEIK
jgi:carbon-monoxide dehydrogenase medium subunit